jgi:hypothetical protein
MALHGRGWGLIEIHRGICLEGLTKTMKSIMKTNDLAEIRNGYLP